MPRSIIRRLDGEETQEWKLCPTAEIKVQKAIRPVFPDIEPLPEER